MKPFIRDESISELDETHEALIKSIRPLDICAEISKKLPNNLKNLLPNNLVKKYTVFKVTDKYSSVIESDEALLQWARFCFDYNRISINSDDIVPQYLEENSFDKKDTVKGAFRKSINEIQNSCIYGRPYILPTEHSTVSSSTFQNSKPDAIMSIGTSLLCSL
jgi:hypothetical protein